MKKGEMEWETIVKLIIILITLILLVILVYAFKEKATSLFQQGLKLFK